MDAMNPWKPGQLPPLTIFAGVFILSALPFLMVALFPAQLHHVMVPASYVVFHNIAEFFSIMVSLSIFGVGWFTYDQTGDRHALFLSAAFLAIGLLDFMHTLSNAAMPAFITPNSSNKSTQFWIAARMFSACAFLGSAAIYPTSKGRWLSKTTLMTAVLLVSGLAFTGIVFFPSFVPATFIVGAGLTPFKKTSEYLIIVLLVLASAAYGKRMEKTKEKVLTYYISAFIICIFSELVFAAYTSVFDTYNVLGHVYKLAAFCLIYQGIFIVSVKAPHIGLLEMGEQLQKDITQRKQLEEELRMHRDHLEYLVRQRAAELETVNGELKRSVVQMELANKELEAFSYSVSHDLMAPLRAIEGFSRKLLADCGDKIDEEGKRFLNIIRKNTQNMGQLIDDLLAFSRNGRTEMINEWVNLEGIVKDTIGSLQIEAGERDILWKIEHMPEVQGDPAMLRLVMANLVSNALKFTRTRPQAIIEIGSISETPDETVFYVKDNGVGFDMRYVGKLFGLFQRLHGQEEFEGTGVGLANVRRIIQRHGGRTWAEGAVDGGATFYASLPKNKAKVTASQTVSRVDS